jgi:hypothetical protein
MASGVTVSKGIPLRTRGKSVNFAPARARLPVRLAAPHLGGFRPPYPLVASLLRDHPVSRAVFRLWQLLQSGCKLSNSFVPPCDTGTMWSTSVASVNRPSARHIRHHSSRRKTIWRSRRHHCWEYILSSLRRFCSLRRLRSFACSSQYRSSVTAGQPGYIHGPGNTRAK